MFRVISFFSKYRQQLSNFTLGQNIEVEDQLGDKRQYKHNKAPLKALEGISFILKGTAGVI